MKALINIFSILIIFVFAGFAKAAEPFITFSKLENSVALKEKNSNLTILTDSNSDKGILRATNDLQSDFERVTGTKPNLLFKNYGLNGTVIIIGEMGNNKTIDALIKSKKIDGNSLKGKNEKFIIQNVSNPISGVSEAIVIAGSDKRGTIYGIYELSKQIGVSPWYYWADVPVVQQENLYFKKGIYTDGEPAVEYRGIFLNDEEPALGGWARATFGGINSKFYEKVFELVLRLKGNYLWPAMWGKTIYGEDPLSGPLANDMGIVMGNSHHEPMMQAQQDWHNYIKANNLPNVWDYSKNKKVLDEFWTKGIERAKDWDKLVTVGMRGDGDEAMEEDTNIHLLENIVAEQRRIIQKVTGKKANKTPQIWALYKEVQDYYDQGMRVPDDVILLYCDDNWGNVRKLPDLSKPLHKGGYGMYYHVDYVGAPRNSKWINISPIQRIWEQMSLSYEHGVDKVWIVNVGDLKPMEFPISFFLDMAWNPKSFNAGNLQEYTDNWAAQQFGETYSKPIGDILTKYTKFNRRVTGEMLDSKTYSLENYNEFGRVLQEYQSVNLDAQRIYNQINPKYKDAYFQLVLYPVDAMSNLYDMYFAQAMNKKLFAENNPEANKYADRVKADFKYDAFLANKYNHEIAGGKWIHMMDQMKIGYKSWSDLKNDVLPEVNYVDEKSYSPKSKTFIENKGYISIEAEDFARKNESSKIKWEIIPDFGKTKSGVTTFPQNLTPTKTDNISLEYDIEFKNTGSFDLQIYLAPTLNYNENKGLKYEISVDRKKQEIINFNGHYKGELGKWQAQAIIISTSKIKIHSPGKHTITFKVLDPGIVLQKLVINTGGLKSTYLGPPESQFIQNK